MKKSTMYLLLALVVLALLSLTFNYKYKSTLPAVVTPPAGLAPEPTIKSEGETTVKLLEPAAFKEITIMPRKVAGDSRCPSDVDCIWAGEVSVETDITTVKGLVAHIFKYGETFNLEGYNLTLTKVEPYPKSLGKITENDYRFTFKVEKIKLETPPVAAGKCYVGGCSAQVCSDQPGVASNCEFKEVYGCFKTAVCERQVSGKCGWTETPTLKACVAEKSV